jgi:hypothetical protein
MDSILRSSVPTMLHVITQHTEILTMKDLTPKCIKVTSTSHLSSHSLSGLRVNAISSREFKLFIFTVVIIE